MNATQLAQRIDTWQRGIVLTLVALVPVVFWRTPISAFQLPKYSLIVAGAVALLLLYAARSAFAGVLTTPSGAPSAALAVFVVAFGLATSLSENPGVSVFGQFNRWSGLVLYVAVAVIFCVIAIQEEPSWGGRLAAAVLIGSGIVVLYAVLQWLGADPLEWSGAVGTDAAFSTQGNSNWTSAIAGMGIPLGIYFALSVRVPMWARWVGGSYVPLALLAVYGSRSDQGWLVAVVAIGGAAGHWLAQRYGGTERGRRWRWVIGIAALAVAAMSAVLLWPRLAAQSDVGSRVDLWQTAVDIGMENPVIGTGPDTFLHHFSQNRPLSHAQQFTGTPADHPHNVPLGMLTGGGFLLLLAYLAFVGTIAWRALAALRPDEPRSDLLAALVGVWAGYQVQSLISIDVPTLILFHFVVAGVIVSLTSPEPVRRVALVDKAPRRGRPWLSPLPVASVLSIVGAAALWYGLLPLRADLAAANGARQAAAGDLETGLASFDRATGLAPWQSIYWFQEAIALERAGRAEAALESVEAAANAAYGTSEYALDAARLAAELDQPERASEWYLTAVRWDPLNAQVIRQAAEYLAQVGDEQTADELRQRLSEVEG